MNQTPFSLLICILLNVLVWLLSSKSFAQSSTENYIKQGVFYIGCEDSSIMQPDTIVKKGILSDGTRFFFYPITSQKEESMTIQLAEKAGEHAFVVAGNVNVALAIDSLEALVSEPGGVNSIPLYTEANILCPTSLYGRIDIRYQLKLSMTSELRNIGYSLQHSVLVNLVATYINNYFVKLRIDNQMPDGVKDVQCLNTTLLSGNDIENLCICIDANPEMRHKAIEAVKQLLKQLAEEGITESELNNAKNIYLEQYNYIRKMLTEGTNTGFMMQHAHIKRIADAYILGNPLYDAEEVSRKLISNVVTINSEFLTEVFRQTIKE